MTASQKYPGRGRAKTLIIWPMPKNGLAGLASQQSLAAGWGDEIELLMSLVGKIEIEDTGENRIALAEAYKEAWREGTTQQQLAKMTALGKADRQVAL
jgi:hypothetical protein